MWCAELGDAAAAAAAVEFPFHEYADKNSAIAALMEYHRKHLELYGVPFGRDGFVIRDMHTLSLLAFTHRGTRYRGGVDCALVPWGVLNPSTYHLIRVAWEHRPSDAAKAAYHAAHPEAPTPVRPSFVLMLASANNVQFKMLVLKPLTHSPHGQDQSLD